MSNKKTIITISIIILILAISAVGFWWFLDKKNLSNQMNNQNQDQQMATSSPEQTGDNVKEIEVGDEINVNDISDWKTYRNELYKFEINYPPSLIKFSDSDINSNFGFKSKDNNLRIHFGSTLPNFWNLTLEEKHNREKSYLTKRSNYEEIKIDNGYVFYFFSKTKGGYEPNTIIIGNNIYLSGGIYLYHDTIEEFNNIEDQKYIEIFQKMLETAKFYE